MGDDHPCCRKPHGSLRSFLLTGTIFLSILSHFAHIQSSRSQYFTSTNHLLCCFYLHFLLVLSPFLFAVYLDDLAKLCNRKSNVFIILYADDILLLAPSLCVLDNLFKICERELNLKKKIPHRLSPLRGSSSPFWPFEPAKVKPN